MTTVRQLLDEKGHEVFSVAANDTVFNALGKMAETDVGALVVMDGEKIVGIITERDYARKVFLMGRASPTTRVQEIMETNVLYAQPDQAVEECMAIMTDKRFRHLPVLERGQLIGIISIGDLVKSIISEQKFVIDQLEHFIHGQRYLRPRCARRRRLGACDVRHFACGATIAYLRLECLVAWMVKSCA